MSFYLAPSLRQCPKDMGVVNPTFARRGSSDGWVGDTSHAARKSDHNPDWNSNGVVRAIDLDIHVGALAGRGMAVVAAAIAHPSVQYIIHAGSIWNRKDGFRRRDYSGHPHTQHVHISIRQTSGAETSTAMWVLPGTTWTLGDRVLYLTNPQMTGDDVRRVQRWAGLTEDDVDGHYGPATAAAVEAAQEAAGLGRDGRVGPETVRRILNPPEPVRPEPTTTPEPEDDMYSDADRTRDEATARRVKALEVSVLELRKESDKHTEQNNTIGTRAVSIQKTANVIRDAVVVRPAEPVAEVPAP